MQQRLPMFTRFTSETTPKGTDLVFEYQGSLPALQKMQHDLEKSFDSSVTMTIDSGDKPKLRIVKHTSLADWVSNDNPDSYKRIEEIFEISGAAKDELRDKMAVGTLAVNICKQIDQATQLDYGIDLIPAFAPEGDFSRLTAVPPPEQKSTPVVRITYNPAIDKSATGIIYEIALQRGIQATIGRKNIVLRDDVRKDEKSLYFNALLPPKQAQEIADALLGRIEILTGIKKAR